MNYAANVSGVANSNYYGGKGSCGTGYGNTAAWILVLFILLVLLLTCFFNY